MRVSAAAPAARCSVIGGRPPPSVEVASGECNPAAKGPLCKIGHLGQRLWEAAGTGAAEVESAQKAKGSRLCSTGQTRARPSVIVVRTGRRGARRGPATQLTGKGQMPDTSSEQRRVEAELAREMAEGEREKREQTRSRVEEDRASAELSRTTAEHIRALAEEVREVTERSRRELESGRQERESLRGAAEEARRAAEDARHATIATVAATADALSAALAQMQFLEDARNTIRQLKIKT